MSDWNSIGELIPHGVAKDLKHAGELGFKAGVDMDMEASAYFNHLSQLVTEKKISMQQLDESVRRILRIKFRLGLFDDPFKYCNAEIETQTLRSEKLFKASLDMARRSIVMLKNEKNILPLKKDLRQIAVIGPLAESKNDPLGPWNQQGNPDDVVTVLKGLQNKLGDKSNIVYSEGCSVDGDSKAGFEHALNVVKNSEIVILCLGESLNMSGEARSRATIDLPGVQEDLAREIVKSGKPVIVVLMNGRPLTINFLSENANAILEAWFLGVQSGNAIADVLFGDYNPSGKLPVTFPKHIGQIPMYYNFKNTGRPYNPNDFYTSYYLDYSNTPLYPFGFGLSYSSFEYSDPVLSKKEISKNESLRISVNVINTGQYDGEEIVQLYIRDLVGSATRPIKELKDFAKIFLKAGETKKVEFTVTPEKLKFYDINMNYVVEPGEFKIFVGTNSVDVKEALFSVVD